MALPNDFKVIGKGLAPASDEVDVSYRKMIEGAITEGVIKAINDPRIVVNNYSINQTILQEKLGSLSLDNPSGILAKTKEYIYSVKEVDSGYASGGMMYKKYSFWIRTSKLKVVLLDEGVLIAPPPPEPLPEEDPESAESGTKSGQKAPPPKEPPKPPPKKALPKEVKSADTSKSKSEKVFLGETHKVATKKDPLRIRSGPSLKNDILGRLPIGVKVKVLNEFLGEDCAWHRIEILNSNILDARTDEKLAEKFKDRAIYCYGSYLEKLDGVPPSLAHTCGFKIDSKASIPDWRKLNPLGHSCFYNAREGEYQAVVELSYQSEDELIADFGSFSGARTHVLETGIKKLIYYYNKDDSDDLVGRILNAFKGAYIPTGAKGFYLDKRPGSFMRFLVSLSAKYFDAINELETDLSKIGSLGGAGGHRSFHFAVSPLKSKIELVAKKMESYAEEIISSGVEIRHLDYKAEARRLREVPAAFNQLLEINGYSLTKLKKEMTVEVCFGKEFNVEWAYLNVDDKNSFPLDVGFVTSDVIKENTTSLYADLYPNGFGFAHVEPITSKRTMAYLYYLDAMVLAIKKNRLPISPEANKTESRELTWSGFTHAFTYPIPEILPSSITQADKTPTAKKAEKVAKIKEKKYKKPAGQAKTTSEIQKETKEISDPQLKLSAASGRAEKKEIVGDNLFEDVEHILRKIVNLDDIYDQLLNKYSIESIAKLVLSFLGDSLPFEDLQSLKFETVLEMIPEDKIDSILSELKQIDPSLYKEAKKLVQAGLTEAKEKGAELDKKYLPAEDDEPAKKPPAKGKKDSLEPLKVSSKTEPTTKDLMTTPKGTNAVYKSPKALGSAASQKEISPTKVGKSQQNALGIDFDVDVSLKGSGAAILNELPPNVRKQLKGPIGKLEKKLDGLIEQKKKLIKEMLNNGTDEAVELVRGQIEALVPDEIKEAAGIFSTITDEVANSSKKPRTPPKNPLIDLPDNFNTSDPMASLVPELESAIEEALTSSLMGIIKSTLKELKSMVDDLLKGKTPDFGRLKNQLPIEAALDAFEQIGANLSEEAVKEFLEQVLESLTGAEVADLLEGKASEDVKQHIKSLAKHKDPDVESVLSSEAEIEEVFTLIGENAGQGVIDFAREPLEPEEFDVATSGLLCDPNEFLDADYSERLSPERAKQQEDAEKQRLKDLAKQLSDLIEDEGQVDGFNPSLSCPEGVFPQDIPSLTNMNRKVIDSLFTSIKMSFSRDASSVANTMLTSVSRPLKPGDPAYIEKVKEDADEGAGVEDSPYEKWGSKRIDLENQKNSTNEQKVAPLLRESLMKQSNFTYDKSAEDWSVKFIIRAPLTQPALKAPGGDSQLVSLYQKDLEKAEAKLILLREALAEMQQPIDVEIDTSEIDKQIAALEGSFEIEGSIAYYKQKIQEELGAKNQGANFTENLVNSPEQFDNLIYNVPFNSDSFEEFKDNYLLKISQAPIEDVDDVDFSSMPITGSKFDINVGNFNSFNSSPTIADTLDWDIHTAPCDAFASFLRARFADDGLTVSSPDDKEDFFKGEGSDFFRDVYTNIFLDLTRKTANQVSKSPLFNIKELKKINILPSNKPGCAPEEAAEQDLLDISNLVEELKDEYESKCEPLGLDEETTTVLEDEMRVGLIKTITRVFMIETLIKSIFCFSEWNFTTINDDKLFIEYISHDMKTRLSEFNLKFYRDICSDSKQIVLNMIASNKEVENPYDLVDMDIIENEDNPLHGYGEEALKLLALQQLPDLLEKFSKKIGKDRKPINRVFTDPPSNRAAPTAMFNPVETTPAGMPVLISNDLEGRGGWIRTINAPSNYRTNHSPENPKSNRFLKASVVSDALGGQDAEFAVSLKYPELVKKEGMFYIEKYIRIEDKEIALDDIDALGEVIRKRHGGPDETKNFADAFLDNPHLSGVVNGVAWHNFLVQIKETDGFSEAKISDYFSSWKYGLRLMWVLPTSLHAKNQTNVFSSLSNPDGGFEENDEMFDADAEIAEAAGNIETASNLEKRFINTVEYSPENFDVIKREKAYHTEESVVAQSALAEGAPGQPKPQAIRYKRIFNTIPLVSVEKPVEDGLLSEFMINLSSDIDVAPDLPYAQLRQQLLDSEEYKFLFEYVFPLPRIATLMTIYTANSIGLAKPEINNAFNGTKEACRALFYNLSADSTNAWWEKKDDKISELGGNAGLLESFLQNQTSMPKDGPKADLLGMAMRAVPVLIRGVAEQVDPHYGLVSKLVDSGVPIKKNWTSVPLLWPTTIPFPAPPFVGWGPPLTPWGMVAYSLPQLTGDEKKYENNEAQEKINKSLDSSLESCEDNEE